MLLVNPSILRLKPKKSVHCSLRTAQRVCIQSQNQIISISNLKLVSILPFSAAAREVLGNVVIQSNLFIISIFLLIFFCLPKVYGACITGFEQLEREAIAQKIDFSPDIAFFFSFSNVLCKYLIFMKFSSQPFNVFFQRSFFSVLFKK